MSKLTGRMKENGAIELDVNGIVIPCIESIEPIEKITEGLYRVRLGLLVHEVSFVDIDGIEHFVGDTGGGKG